MASRSTLFLVLLGALLGVALAGSIEDEFYRSIRAQATIAGIDDSHEQHAAAERPKEPSKPNKEPPKEPQKERDSWKKLATDMVAYLKLLSRSSEGLEKKLKDLSEKVERDLDVGRRESYTLNYAKQLLQEQRAVIEALRAGALGESTEKRTPSYEDVLQKTEQFVKPTKASTAPTADEVDSELASEHEKLLAALKNLQNLKI
ncbi:hypothetical protein RP20_CCG016474 [Aedes albopictus]|nr:hypothetical protein RP20_CCG016474 [Aedes albopictus]